MSDIKPEYRSKNSWQAIAHVAEECSEAATAAAKTLRWGMESVNPELPEDEQETNLDWLRREIGNVARAWVELDRILAEEGWYARGELISDIGTNRYEARVEADKRALQAAVGKP